MRRLFRVTATLGFSNSLVFVSSLIKAKLIAIFLGPAGMGFISQLNGLLNFLNNLGTLGMQQGVTKFSAEDKAVQKKGDSDNILYVALFLVGLITLVLALVTTLFSKSISLLVFSDPSYSKRIILIALACPFIAFVVILNYYLKGIGNIRLIFKASILSSVISLAVSFLLIFFLRLKGAIFQIFTTAFISFFVFYVFFYFLSRDKHRKTRLFNTFSFSYLISTAKELLKHGSVIYVSNALLPLSLLIIRSLIIKRFGIEQTGIFQSVMLISAIAISFPSETLWAGYFPEINRDRSIENQKKKMMNFINFLALIGIPAITCAVMLQDFFVKLLFSANFSPAVQYLPIRLLGDFIYMLGSAIGLIFFANSFLGTVLFFSILWNVLLVGLSFALVNLVGFEGTFIAYVITCFLILVFQSIILKKKVKISIGAKDLARVVMSIIAVSSACFIALNKFNHYFYLLPMFIWGCLFFKKIKIVVQRFLNARKQ